MPLQKIPKEDVLAAIEKIGPSQPIDVRKELHQGDSFLIGALMSELVAEGKLRITATRRGGSPFYFDPAKPERLEAIQQYLNEKDRRTIAMLREQRVMREDSQDPLVRVGLKNTPDFSMRMEADGVVYWRYFLTSEEEALRIIGGAPAPVPAEPVAEPAAHEPVKEARPKRERKRAKPEARAEAVIASNEEAPSPQDAQRAPASPKGAPKRKGKKAAEPVMMPDGAVMISPQEWLAHDTLYERVVKHAAGMPLRDARVHKPHGELTCIMTVSTQFGDIDAFVHAFNKKFTVDDIKASMPRARELGLPVIVLSVDAIPTKVSGAFKGMPNIIFKRL